MNPLIFSVLVGLVTLFIAFKLLKLAIKAAFIVAIGVAGIAAYFAFLAT